MLAVNHIQIPPPPILTPAFKVERPWTGKTCSSTASSHRSRVEENCQALQERTVKLLQELDNMGYENGVPGEDSPEYRPSGLTDSRYFPIK